MTKRLQDRRILITGGSRGLGLAMALAFAREGARIAFTYSKRDADADEARTRIAAEGHAPRVFKGSVADGKHAREVIDALVTEWGGLDVLVNNAGVNHILPVALIDEPEWDEVMNVNVKGTFLFSRAALRPMIRAKAGIILNMGSFASERIVESPVHYAASKSALRGLTESLAREVGRYGIRVNLLSPGLFDTGLSTNLPKHRVNEYLSQCPLGRLAKVDEVAELAVFLVSAENTFMTGAKLAVDGGL